jgi:hypothetical protein
MSFHEMENSQCYLHAESRMAGVCQHRRSPPEHTRSAHFVERSYHQHGTMRLERGTLLWRLLRLFSDTKSDWRHCFSAVLAAEDMHEGFKVGHFHARARAW